MAENSTIKPCKILRKSAHTFLTHFHHFSSSPTLLCLPFSLCFLLHLSTADPTTLRHRLHSLLVAGGFPINSPTSHLILLKLSETLSSSLYSLPLSLSFLLLSKSYTIQFLQCHRRRSHPPPPESAYFTLLYTQICNLFILVAANSACFTLLCLAFTAANAAFDPSPAWASAGISIAGAVFYPVVFANAIVVCNLSLIASGWEGKGGFVSILRACVLIRCRATTALFLALPSNLAMAAAEVVFRCRVFGSGAEERPAWTVAAEAVLIAYLYSVLIVGDTIVGCLFYTSCKEEEEEEEVVYESDLNKLRALEEGIQIYSFLDYKGLSLWLCKDSGKVNREIV